MKLSRLFHKAADYYLWDGDFNENQGHTYSCNAISSAIGGTRKMTLPRQIREGLIQMGLTDPGAGNAFGDIDGSAARQGARYLWLKWCALMAEEQGL